MRVKRNSVVPSHARSVVPLADAIVGAMQNSGPALFSHLLRERAAHVPPAAAAAKSLLLSARSLVTRVRHQGILATAQRGIETVSQGFKLAATAPPKVRASLEASRDYFTQLPSAQDKAEYGMAVVLYLISFLSGFAVGFQVPQVNLQIDSQGTPGDRIVLHAFPLMMAELSVDWLGAILHSVRDSRHLSPTDYRRANSLAQIADNLRSGLRTGAATLAWQKRNLGLLPLQGKKDIAIALHKRAFAQAEQLFQALTQGEKK